MSSLVTVNEAAGGRKSYGSGGSGRSAMTAKLRSPAGGRRKRGGFLLDRSPSSPAAHDHQADAGREERARRERDVRRPRAAARRQRHWGLRTGTGEATLDLGRQPPV